jgi:glutathione synthase/RimK-type ligase-like ATP-grasp enzyme
MPDDQRIFVDAICRYCRAHGIACEVKSEGWLVVMERYGRRHFAFGYDIGLNGATAHRIANDKSASSEVLAFSGVPSIPHTLFLSPRLGNHIVPEESRDEMLGLLRSCPKGLVIKPNEGTSGRSVFRVENAIELDRAVTDIFSSHLSLAISPYVEIEDEVRVILLDDVPRVVYCKQRGSDWRHNLEFGAQPVLLEQGEAREMCAGLAIRAAHAIGIRFASIDVVRVGTEWKVLELNSGVMMEMLGKLHPELVHATYCAALDKVFG